VSKVIEIDLDTVMHNQRIGSLCRQKRKLLSDCPILKMSVNQASMMFGVLHKVTEYLFGRCYAEPTYWQPLLAKNKATHSLPNSENEHQLSIIDFWFFILGNSSGNWLETSITQVLTAFEGINKSHMLPAAA